jgi:glycosyltransferase involved in cell wall biosynthesis
VSTDQRILVVTGIYPPDIGGPATYVPQLCAQLHKSGFKVHVVSLTENSNQKRISEPWNRTFISRNHWKPIRVFKTILILFKLSLGAQAIFSNGLYEEVGILSLFIKRKRIVAKIVGDPVWERFKNSSGSAIDIESFNKQTLSKNYAIQRRFLKWSLNRFTEVSCPSDQLKELIHSWGVTKRVTVIKNGIRCHSIIPLKPKYDIITVSRLVSWKNLDKLILAIANRDFTLAICGEGPEKSNLQLLASKSNSNVKFLGQLSGSDLDAAINESQVFALISSYEGLSFALLEAMMSGKKILVSNVRGNTDVIRNNQNGIIVDPMNLEQITSALDTLLKYENPGNSLSIAAHEDAILLYCAETQMNKMIDLLAS